MKNRKVETLTITKVTPAECTAVHAWATGWQELSFPSKERAFDWAKQNDLEVRGSR